MGRQMQAIRSHGESHANRTYERKARRMQPQYTNANVIRNEILVDPELNSRKHPNDANLTKLRDSIKQQGLIHPPLLIRIGQLNGMYVDSKCPYVLVAGFRRQAALDLLAKDEGLQPNQQSADYRIAPVDWSIEDALLANLTENLGREDLTSYELASQCVELKERYKLTAKEISNRVRSFDAERVDRKPLSETHINNLMRCRTELHQTILDAWQSQHPKASLRVLISLASEKDLERQLRMWQGVESGNPADDAGNDDPAPAADPENRPARRPTPAQLTVAVERIQQASKDGKKDVDWCKGAIAALKYAAGSSQTIPGIRLTTEEDDAK